MDAYQADLAYVHDRGFGFLAKAVAEEMPGWLREAGHRGSEGGLVVDLGCGSGIFAEEMTLRGYRVLGFDLSPEMVKLAKKRAPKARFHVGSFVKAELPECVAVTACGEILNYLFDAKNTEAGLRKIFRRVHEALVPGGLFVFDVALPGRAPGGQVRNFREGEDWACLFEATENERTRILTRRITTFRQVPGRKLFRRSQETHRLRLLDQGKLDTWLRAEGFATRTVGRYGSFEFPPGYVGFIARKEA